ncbi:hypothetical protein M3223_14575 [Paenibacillus pasadenensis]|uniref:hypothetical protein n=1 Tax=Paenibacillus pasadenensis TaxID=217090 RepID=UPI00203E0AF3|nr:hypothetical protein [Paenibacillus pasadenensis]MCM3748573.1 hypothetical protein [Paenibacillus pasadenensis]
MKKWIISLSLIIVIAGAAWITYLKYPRTIDVKLSGVKYQAGAEGAKSGTEPSTVVIQGVLRTSLKGDRVFKGEISIAGEKIPVPLDQRELEIPFSSDGWGSMMYSYYTYNENGATKGILTHHSHLLFANKDFSQVTLLLNTPAKGSQSWNLDNRYLISAPAASGEEGLIISNTLMSKFLRPVGKLQ